MSLNASQMFMRGCFSGVSTGADITSHLDQVDGMQCALSRLADGLRLGKESCKDAFLHPSRCGFAVYRDIQKLEEWTAGKHRQSPNLAKKQ